MNRVAKVFIGISLLALLLGPGASPVRAQENATCATDAVVQAGDTLSSIAGRYYGSIGAYTRIVDATNAQSASDSGYATIANANLITVGWKLCIPGPLNTQDAANVSAAAQATPIPTVAPTPVPIPTPPAIDLDAGELHPLQIEYMRQQSYPGSDLVIEQTLAPGTNYNRYVVSYLSEGNKIFALLTIPTDAKPATGWPVILFNHGYIPPEIYRTTERYIAYTDAISRAGYILLKSDYRGHGFSEGESTRANRSTDYTADVLNALGTIKRHPDVDPNRIGFWGHSMGGQITLRAMVVNQEIKAGVIWAGTVGTMAQQLERRRERAIRDPEWASHTRQWREELIAAYGSPEENPAFWASISPNSYVVDLSGPIQLHHGTADSSVPVAFSDTLFAQIQGVDGTVENYTYQGDNHNISANFGTAMARSVAFFDKYVK